MAELNTELMKDKVDGQHWTIVRELWMRKDKEQCESWKDEVQNVLIFSGLFSAIVTAFLIESHKALRQDSAQESVQLLKQIAAQIAGQTYRVSGPGKPAIDYTTSVCVNVSWFLSLVLSLTAALIGIVSLQWIRAHLRTLGDGSESLGLSHMHSLGLQKSYIPLIFTSLPVILILGLAFFLVGLIVFLFELSWPVAIPVAIAVGCTFVFLLATTLHPALQSFPRARLIDNPDCFPSPYRSPQSLLFLGRRDWRFRSQIWLRRRQEDFAVKRRPLSHLESRPEGIEVGFAYDTIKALVAVKEGRSAESENERTALAKCLAEVLPIHLDLFATRDLADLIPFLPPSEFVPSALFSHKDSATWEDLCAVALVQIATCKGSRPFQSAALVKACVVTTRWLFERPHTLDSVPDRQPLHLISKPDELTPDILEVLISTLTRFFTFAADYQPESQIINKTTHTSSYTYWFLVLSAKILTKCSLSVEMQNRHAYLLALITTRLSESKVCDYLFFTASIYASVISESPVMCLSPFGGKFLRAVMSHCGRLYDLSYQLSQLRRAVKANEVAWGNIDRALEALGPSGASAGKNDTMGGHLPLSGVSDRDPTLGEGKESSGRSGDRDSATTQGGGLLTPVHGGGSSQYTPLEEINSPESGRNSDGEVHEGELDIVIDSPP